MKRAGFVVAAAGMGLALAGLALFATFGGETATAQSCDPCAELRMQCNWDFNSDMEAWSL